MGSTLTKNAGAFSAGYPDRSRRNGSSMKGKPRKPTEPFGHIAFGKDGSVTKRMDELSSDKDEQEGGAIHRFAERLRDSLPSLVIEGLTPLSQADHDFLLRTSAGDVTVQLTELVERDYARPISAEEYNRGVFQEYIQKAPGAIPWGIDTERRDTALRRVIQKKIDKNYAKAHGETLWLVVFSTSSSYLTEYFEAVERKESRGLDSAVRYLNSLQQCVFDRVWYTNLQSRPVLVWPREQRSKGANNAMHTDGNSAALHSRR